MIDHQKNHTALSASEGCVTSGIDSKLVITTKGWDIQVRWRDGSINWLPVLQVKEAIPIELAEYAVAQKINLESAFNWWVTKTLRKRERIINKIGTRKAQKPYMKFGVEIPHEVKEAKELHHKNINTYWQDAFKKEYDNVKVAFFLMK